MTQHERRFRFYCLAGLLLLLPAGGRCAAGASSLAAPSDAQPGELDGAVVLARRCVGCHNATKQAGGIDLSSLAAATRARAAGPALSAGRPEASRLYQLVAAGRMP